jgi:hypothetical protein
MFSTNHVLLLSVHRRMQQLIIGPITEEGDKYSMYNEVCGAQAAATN